MNFLTAIISKPLIDWQLAVTLVIVEVPIGLLFHFLAKDKKESKMDRKEAQYDVKKINTEVFKKLIHVVCLEYYPFFENKFGFCIPKHPQEFKDLELTPVSIGFNIQLGKIPNVEELLDKIESVIPTLEVGENFLKENYQKIYKDWEKIKQELDALNKDQQDFCNKISERIMNEFKKYYHLNPTFRLSPFRDEENWAYFSDNVPRIASLIFNKYGIIDFTTDIFDNENQFYVTFAGWRILGFNKKERIDDLGAIKEVFNNIANENKLVDNHRKFGLRLIKLNEKIEAFCKQLEKRVVNDIDNQL
jgi:hypothetical protein